MYFPLCFDYVVDSEIIMNSGIMKTMRLTLYNNMSLP